MTTTTQSAAPRTPLWRRAWKATAGTPARVVIYLLAVIAWIFVSVYLGLALVMFLLFFLLPMLLGA